MSCQRFQFQNQNQVGAALVAFGEAISELLRPLVQRDLPIEACSAVRLSLSRQVQIMPALNLLAMSTTDAVPSTYVNRMSSVQSPFPHENLSLVLMSRRLTTLFALSTAQRMQTLSCFKCSNIILADSMVIRVPERLKTSLLVEIPMLVAKINDDCILGIDFLEKINLGNIFESIFHGQKELVKNNIQCYRVEESFNIPSNLRSLFEKDSKHLN
ncbi:hypothetical protein ALC57_05619 [Trachymyrmex cornetzi]|uniref:Uncharacterized protein n=1 Tax=Trachymyrmex cornetzi TaxID=471704 RepID=A0A151JAA6_9HYME|nr:hypothetical protein ALC57_05619 [Trachymyrmex cornetzi]